MHNDDGVGLKNCNLTLMLCAKSRKKIFGDDWLIFRFIFIFNSWALETYTIVRYSIVIDLFDDRKIYTMLPSIDWKTFWRAHKNLISSSHDVRTLFVRALFKTHNFSLCFRSYIRGTTTAFTRIWFYVRSIPMQMKYNRYDVVRLALNTQIRLQTQLTRHL